MRSLFALALADFGSLRISSWPTEQVTQQPSLLAAANATNSSNASNATKQPTQKVDNRTVAERIEALQAVTSSAADKLDTLISSMKKEKVYGVLEKKNKRIEHNVLDGWKIFKKSAGALAVVKPSIDIPLPKLYSKIVELAMDHRTNVEEAKVTIDQEGMAFDKAVNKEYEQLSKAKSKISAVSWKAMGKLRQGDAKVSSATLKTFHKMLLRVDKAMAKVSKGLVKASKKESKGIRKALKKVRKQSSKLEGLQFNIEDQMAQAGSSVQLLTEHGVDGLEARTRSAEDTLTRVWERVQYKTHRTLQRFKKRLGKQRTNLAKDLTRLGPGLLSLAMNVELGVDDAGSSGRKVMVGFGQRMVRDLHMLFKECEKVEGMQAGLDAHVEQVAEFVATTNSTIESRMEKLAAVVDPANLLEGLQGLLESVNSDTAAALDYCEEATHALSEQVQRKLGKLLMDVPTAFAMSGVMFESKLSMVLDSLDEKKNLLGSAQTTFDGAHNQANEILRLVKLVKAYPVLLKSLKQATFRSMDGHAAQDLANAEREEKNVETSTKLRHGQAEDLTASTAAAVRAVGSRLNGTVDQKDATVLELERHGIAKVLAGFTEAQSESGTLAKATQEKEQQFVHDLKYLEEYPQLLEKELPARYAAIKEQTDGLAQDKKSMKNGINGLFARWVGLMDTEVDRLFKEIGNDARGSPGAEVAKLDDKRDKVLKEMGEADTTIEREASLLKTQQTVATARIARDKDAVVDFKAGIDERTSDIAKKLQVESDEQNKKLDEIAESAGLKQLRDEHKNQEAMRASLSKYDEGMSAMSGQKSEEGETEAGNDEKAVGRTNDVMTGNVLKAEEMLHLVFQHLDDISDTDAWKTRYGQVTATHKAAATLVASAKDQVTGISEKLAAVHAALASGNFDGVQDLFDAISSDVDAMEKGMQAGVDQMKTMSDKEYHKFKFAVNSVDQTTTEQAGSMTDSLKDIQGKVELSGKELGSKAAGVLGTIEGAAAMASTGLGDLESQEKHANAQLERSKQNLESGVGGLQEALDKEGPAEKKLAADAEGKLANMVDASSPSSIFDRTLSDVERRKALAGKQSGQAGEFIRKLSDEVYDLARTMGERIIKTATNGVAPLREEVNFAEEDKEMDEVSEAEDERLADLKGLAKSVGSLASQLQKHNKARFDDVTKRYDAARASLAQGSGLAKYRQAEALEQVQSQLELAAAQDAKVLADVHSTVVPQYAARQERVVRLLATLGAARDQHVAVGQAHADSFILDRARNDAGAAAEADATVHAARALSGEQVHNLADWFHAQVRRINQAHPGSQKEMGVLLRKLHTSTQGVLARAMAIVQNQDTARRTLAQQRQLLDALVAGAEKSARARAPDAPAEVALRRRLEATAQHLATGADHGKPSTLLERGTAQQFQDIEQTLKVLGDQRASKQGELDTELDKLRH